MADRAGATRIDLDVLAARCAGQTQRAVALGADPGWSTDPPTSLGSTRPESSGHGRGGAPPWLLFDRDGARDFIEHTQRVQPFDDATWTRARAWALRIAVAVLAGPPGALREDMPRVLRTLTDA